MNDKLKRIRWTSNEIEILKKLYPDIKTEDIAIQMNKKLSSVYSKASILGLKKSLELKQELTTIKNKNMGRDLTPELLMQIASQYNSRGEFLIKDGSAYQTARRAGLLNNICNHMQTKNFSIPQLILRDILDFILKTKSLYNSRKIISPYEVDVYYPEFRLAFEYQGKGWHVNNKRDVIKEKLFHGNDINVIYIVENSRLYETDIKAQLITNINKINLICNTNISHHDILDYKVTNVYSKVYNTNDLLKISNDYSSFKLFKKEQKPIYVKLCKLKLIDQATSHMKDKRKKRTLEEITSIVMQYSVLKDFISNEPAVYLFIQRHRLWNLIQHMKSNHRWKSTLCS